MQIHSHNATNPAPEPTQLREPVRDLTHENLPECVLVLRMPRTPPMRRLDYGRKRPLSLAGAAVVTLAP